MRKFNPLSLKIRRLQADREIVFAALARSQFNMARTARELEISRTGLYRLVRRLNLQLPLDRAAPQHRLGERGRI